MARLQCDTWGREFRHLIQQFTEARRITAEEIDQKYYHIKAYVSELTAVIHDLLDPKTRLAADFPSLHRILSHRYNAALASQQTEISRCSHLADGRRRSDSYHYQGYILLNRDSDIADQATRNKVRWANRCSIMTDHFVVRGILGTGTYGVVFLAHKNNEDHLYAIKMENLVTIGTSMQYYAQPTVVGCIGPQPMVAPLFTEEFVDYHYIPVEAYILLLTNESDRFPTLDSVYTHGYYQAIVMDAHVDDEVAESAYDPDAPFAKWNEERFSSCGGHNFVYMKETKLQEYMVCKIASHLLEGIAYLRDMRICHNDLTMSNFVIDKNLNTTLLDVGLFTFALTDDDYWAPDFTYVPGYEGNSTPEVILALLRDIYRDRLKKRTQIQVGVPHDVRKTGLWMLAADIYELLHGYMPWENPEWDGRVSYLSQWKQQGIPRGHEQLRSYEANRRRHRVVNLEIPLRESLSQDCADAMLMMFAKDTKKRPTLPEMESFVWFGQWDYLDPEQFQRPAPYDT